MTKRRAGHTERLPADFEQPREQHQMSPAGKLSADLGPLLHTSPETRFDAVRAVTYNHNQQAGTVAEARIVLEALGLAVRRPPAPAAGQPQRIGYRDVPCPQCYQGVGQPCLSKNNLERATVHRGRHRRAEELRGATT